MTEERSTKRPKGAKFDPMENMHLWVMWRTAVNERIIRETRRPKHRDDGVDHFSKVFTTVPLARYVRLNYPGEGSKPYSGPLRQREWYNDDGFQTRQLVYFGLPRPRLVHQVLLPPDY